MNRKRGERVLVNGSDVGFLESVQSVICRHLNSTLRQETGRDDYEGEKNPEHHVRITTVREIIEKSKRSHTELRNYY